MGLITKEIIVKWNTMNKLYYESKGYIFTKYKGEFIVNTKDLIKCSSVKVCVECDNCGEISTISYVGYNENLHEGKHYCNACATKLFGTENMRKTKLKKSISFKQWCVKNLTIEESEDVLSRWDYDKNQCSPDDIGFSAKGKGGFWFKCKFHDSEKKNIASFTSGEKGSINCNQCSKIHFTRPDLIKYFLDIEDTKKYSAYSSAKVYMICPDCGHIKKQSIRELSSQGFSCPKCSDGISYPNKFAFNLLEQLNLHFIREYKTSWSMGKKYDFYFIVNGLEYILEMDGNFHFNDNRMNGQTKEESNSIDIQKNILAQEHNIDIIRIVSIKSEKEYIKANILDSKLSEILDLSIVDWDDCEKYALISLVKVACKKWLEYHNVIDISKNMDMDQSTIRDYLKRGAAINLCDYNPKKESEKRYKNQSHHPKKGVMCINTNEIFESLKQAEEKYDIKRGYISHSIRGRLKFAGINPISGENLYWKYYEVI